MPISSDKARLQIVVDKTMADRLKALSKKEHRSISSMAAMIFDLALDRFEWFTQNRYEALKLIEEYQDAHAHNLGYENASQARANLDDYILSEAENLDLPGQLKLFEDINDLGNKGS